MASTISAGTSAGTAIAIAGDTTGNLAFTTQAGTYTQTLPNATGTVMVSGNQPAFSAYQNASGQSISSGTFTKVTYDAELFDTNNNFASSTFTPTVAGYYQLSAAALYGGAGVGASSYLSFYKNGSEYKRGIGMYVSSLVNPSLNSSALVYANGTTDYFDVYIFQATGSSVSLNNTDKFTWFTGCLVRTA